MTRSLQNEASSADNNSSTGFPRRNSCHCVRFIIAGAIARFQHGKVLASGSQDKAVRLWDVATGELLQAKEDFPRRVKKVVFRPDGETLVTGDAQQIQLWRLSS